MTAAGNSGEPGWEIERVDLSAYLLRIGIEPQGQIEPDLRTLRRLQRAHLFALPFGNVDILLSHSVELDLASIQRKLVTGRRGGYCHEHNLLFAAVLERLGYQVTRLSGRVRLGGGHHLRPRTHMVLSVRSQGADFLVDVGFGSAAAPVEPIPLHAGATAAQDGVDYELQTGPPDGWLLRVWQSGGWSDLYSFGSDGAHLIDLRVATHYTSTHPQSPFTTGLRLSQFSSDMRYLLQDRQLREQPPGGEPRRIETLDDRAFAHTLSDTFGLRLHRSEVEQLARFSGSQR